MGDGKNTRYVLGCKCTYCHDCFDECLDGTCITHKTPQQQVVVFIDTARHLTRLQRCVVCQDLLGSTTPEASGSTSAVFSVHTLKCGHRYCSGCVEKLQHKR